jgi:hypothetical protein
MQLSAEQNSVGHSDFEDFHPHHMIQVEKSFVSGH